MRKLFCCIIYFMLSLPLHNIRAQDSLSVKDSTNVVQTQSADTVLINEKFYLFKNLIHQVFGGYAQAGKFNPRQQMFDFMEMGRPQFVAPLNMFPQQSTYIYNGFSLNEHSNGMFNTRFLSADHIDNIDYSENPFALNSVTIFPLTISEKEAYTRLKYYEGDQGYSDLDIFFVRDISQNVKIQLAGFNKGYGGFAFNSRHTGVAYDTRLSWKFSDSFAGELSWLRNHEISGMGTPYDAKGFTYQADAERFATRFFYKYDSTANDQLSLGLLYGYNYHKNRRSNDYSARQITDNYRAYLSNDISDSLYSLSTTLRMDRYDNYGSVFSKDFTDLIVSANVLGKYQVLKNAVVEGAAEIRYLDSFDPALGLSAGINLMHLPLATKLKAVMTQRLPNPVERSIAYREYTGNSNLNPETFLSLSLQEKWLVNRNLNLQAELGYSKIQDEITLSDDTFKNGSDRSWSFFNGQGTFAWWLFTLSGGGQLISAKKYISPRQNLWSEISIHGALFGGTIILDISGFTQWNSTHDLIQYDPVVNRFYSGQGKNLSYTNAGVKAVATVGDAQLFMEMDNLLKDEITYIEGYSRYTRRVRFGVNWIFWD